MLFSKNNETLTKTGAQRQARKRRKNGMINNYHTMANRNEEIDNNNNHNNKSKNGNKRTKYGHLTKETSTKNKKYNDLTTFNDARHIKSSHQFNHILRHRSYSSKIKFTK